MLKESLQNLMKNQSKVELYPEEYNFVIDNGLINSDTEVVKIDGKSRFHDAYMERSNKETEEFLAEENASFLNERITYFKEHMNEFLYMESKWFTLIGIDAISFEVDDLFGTYDVMLGLKIQKKYSSKLRDYFTEHSEVPEEPVDLMFDAQEGIWNINFSLHTLPGFREDMTVAEAYQLVYAFIFSFVQTI
ncbi:branched-chain amino acid aminotransferase [Robertmurraya sp. GLU-23]